LSSYVTLVLIVCNDVTYILDLVILFIMWRIIIADDVVTGCVI
jgi:hypothetical protein